jgi:putative nucleotidyltransferase with HDIG domain
LFYVLTIFTREIELEFIIYCQDKKKSLYLKYLLETSFSCEVFDVDSIRKLSSNSNASFYIACVDEKLNEMDQGLIKKIENKPSLYISKNIEVINTFLINFPTIETKLLKEPSDISSLIKKISVQLGLSVNTRGEDELFVAVRTDYLLKVNHYLCDIYIKISDEKYLKIFKSNVDFNIDDLARLNKKNIEYVYVKDNDFEKLLDSMNVFEPECLAEEVQLGKVTISSELSFTQDILHKLTGRIGINEKVTKYVQRSLTLLFSFLEQDQDLKKLLRYLEKDRNFLSEHSIMVACVASAVLGQTTYGNDANNLKLSLAAIFHDLGINKEKFHGFELLQNDDYEDLSKRELDAYKGHVVAGFEILEKFSSIPSDVDKIILHHHEKYDGSGFPRGVGWSKIPFLSVVFIVSHELVVYFFKNEYSEEKFLKFIEEKKKVYHEGSFKEIILALEKIRH